MKKIIKEDPDRIRLENGEEITFFDSDAVPFFFMDNRAIIGHNVELMKNTPKLQDKAKNYVGRSSTHNRIKEFYMELKIPVDKEYFIPGKNIEGRVWLDKQYISFWDMPDKNELLTVLNAVSREFKRIYNINVDLTNFKLEVIDKNGTRVGIIPVKQYSGEAVSVPQELRPIHTLPPEEKRNTQQMKDVRTTDIEYKAKKFDKTPEYLHNFLKTTGIAEADKEPTINEELNRMKSLIKIKL